MSAGFTFPWERAAMHGEEMPEGLCIYEQAAFQAIRCLYQSFYAKTIERSVASKEKRMIQKALNDAVSQAQYEQKLAFGWAERNRLTEAAKTVCRKDPSPENALRLVKVLDG